MKQISEGQTSNTVRSLLGEPALVLDEDGLNRSGDARWVYGHHRRGKLILTRLLVTILEFKNERLIGIQRLDSGRPLDTPISSLFPEPTHKTLPVVQMDLAGLLARIENLRVVGRPPTPISDDEIKFAEKNLGTHFPSGYQQYITTLGEGVLGGAFVRIYPPRKVVEELAQWRERIEEYWFWKTEDDDFSKSKALECIVLGDTLQGDEVIFHPSNPERLFVLPRHDDAAYWTDGFFETLEWLCASGVLTGPFEERDFEPIQDSDELT